MPTERDARAAAASLFEDLPLESAAQRQRVQAREAAKRRHDPTIAASYGGGWDMVQAVQASQADPSSP